MGSTRMFAASPVTRFVVAAELSFCAGKAEAQCKQGQFCLCFRLANLPASGRRPSHPAPCPPVLTHSARVDSGTQETRSPSCITIIIAEVAFSALPRNIAMLGLEFSLRVQFGFASQCRFCQSRLRIAPSQAVLSSPTPRNVSFPPVSMHMRTHASHAQGKGRKTGSTEYGDNCQAITELAWMVYGDNCQAITELAWMVLERWLAG